LVLTASTLSLQSVAAANRDGKVRHVFAGVTDPYGAGVGITGPGKDEHPPHLVGVGTFQPVANAIRVAREMNPQLKRLGVVWTTGEDNSLACVKVARLTCSELGIELIEANASTTLEVSEAVRSVLARRVDAIWIGGDTVAIAAMNTIVAAASSAGVPVFTNDPSDVERGAIFGLGASYIDVGRFAGTMAGKLLHGAHPNDFGVANMVPELLRINESVTAAHPGWRMSDSLTKLAAASVTAVAPSPRAGPQQGRIYRVGMLYFGPHPIFDLAIEGTLEALAEAGFEQNRNLQIMRSHPNDDMSILPQTVRNMIDRKPDLIIAYSTPVLAALLAQNRDIPTVFSVVSAPLRAGAGRSYEEKLSHVTGSVWPAPSSLLFEWLQRLVPHAATVGVIYNPGEVNSVEELDRARQMLAKQGIRIEARAIATSSDITQAMQSLISEGVDAIFGMADNTVVNSFPALVRIARRANIPVFADDRSLMGTGALMSVGTSPRAHGKHSGQLVARILAGESPATIPMQPTMDSEIVVDLEAAMAHGILLPTDLLAGTDVFLKPTATQQRAFRIAMVNLVNNPSLDAAEAGVERGLAEAGLLAGRDYVLRKFSAQGEIGMLPAIIDAAKADRPDVLVTVTTPAMMAAARKLDSIPVVFTVASDPKELGLFSPDERPEGIVGVHDDPPLDALLQMAMAADPTLDRVGIVYDAAEPNSLISVRKLRQATEATGVNLLEATASSASDLPSATQSLLQRGVQAILLSADNLVTTGFPAIVGPAKGAGVPVYVTMSSLMDQGASGFIGDDYEAWGAQSGLLVARVLAGVPASQLPIEPTQVHKCIGPGQSMAPASAVDTPLPVRKRPFEIRLVRYNDAQFSIDSQNGILQGFAHADWEQGRDFNLRVYNAQADMGTLSSIMTTIRADRPDLIMTISTPALQAAIRNGGGLPTVFTSVADAVMAGAGTSEVDHLPHLTGITTRSPFEAMADLLVRTFPNLRSVGTLFTPAEVNSECYREWFEEALTAKGIELITKPVTQVSDVPEAMLGLLNTKINVIAQIADNTTRPAYSQIVRRANEAGIPFICFDSAGMRDGAALAYARDYFDAGVEAAEVAVRVLSGTPPATIPFAVTRSEILVINPDVLARHGMILPDDIRSKASLYTPESK
jgi:ABC-type uncharacterized transport system substrate-binding protein